MNPNLVTLSKFLAKHLRHAPEALGLTLEPGGWVGVDELLAASARVGFPIAYDDLIACVETNDKKRYAFDESGDRIRARSGHSTEVDLQLVETPPPAELFHGTVERFLAAILVEGLKKGKRHHVHLSKDTETRRRGRRPSRQAGPPLRRFRANAPRGFQVLHVDERRLADRRGAG